MAAAQFSVAGAERRDPMRDYLVGSTHRKDALVGELWNRLRDQITGRAATDASVAASRQPLALTGSGFTLVSDPSAGARALSGLLAHALGVLRWEPLNPNPEHRPCPSPGSRFPVYATVSVRNRGELEVYRYMPRDHALIRVSEHSEADLPMDSIEIALFCDLAKCASPYGELSYCLATLELGAVLAQLVLVAREFDLRLDRIRVAVGSGADRPAAMPRLTTILVAPEIATWIRETDPALLTVLDERYPPVSLGDFPLLDAMLSACAPLTGVCAGLTARWPGSAPGSVFLAGARRSSGLQLQGTSHPTVLFDRDRLTAWLDLVAAVYASFTGLTQHGVRVDILPPETEHVERADQRRLSEGSALFVSADASGNRAWGYFAPLGAAIVTLSAEYRRYVETFGENALFHMHLAAGIASQVVGLASAAMGLVCRPMRSFDHAAVDATLPIDNWSVLQLVVWADVAVNPAFPTATAAGASRL